jgi:hypothetical protein
VCVRESECVREKASENVGACVCVRVHFLGALQMSSLIQNLGVHILITHPPHSNLLLNILATQAPPAKKPSSFLPHPASPAWQNPGKSVL